MSNFGNIGEFRAEEEQFSSYTERIEAYFIANDIKEEAKKKSIFITSIGPKTYKLLRDLILPKKPMNESLEKILQILSKHFEPKPCEIVERFRFNSCNRKEEQSTADYVAELRRLSEFCNYGDKLDEHLRDRLVCGIKDNRIQRRLLSESDLTLQRAIEICIGVEVAEKNMVTLEEQTKMPEIHLMKKEEGRGGYREYGNKFNNHKEKCIVCGRSGHDKKECRFRNAKCFLCGKVGHLKTVCKGGVSKETHAVSQGKRISDDEENVYSMFNIEKGSNGVLYSNIRLNDVICKLQVDTGAAVSIISENTWFRVSRGNKKVTMRNSNVRLKTFTGELVPVLGKIEVGLEDKQSASLFVVRGSVPNIAGRDLINKL